jgi:hypothetical protein
VKKIYDDGFSLGGPIAKRLWFFSAFRRWGAEEYQPNAYYNAVQGTGLYKPDLTRPAYYISTTFEDDGHVTWQASQKDKVSFFVNYGNTCSCIQGVAANVAPEATLNNIIPNSLTQATWSRVQSSKLLLEAGYTFLHTSFGFPHTAGDVNYKVSANDIPTTELSTGMVYGARAATSLAYTDFPNAFTDPAGQQNLRGSASYVTGSHAFKFGGSWQRGILEESGQVNTLPGFGPVSFQLLNGKPVSLTEYISPQFQSQGFRNAALYAQDQWTLNHLTLNLGVRGDFFNGFYPDQDIPSSTFVPGFHISGRDGVPSWKDVSPRLGVAYKLTNDGNTVIKVSAGRFVAAQGAGLPQSINPASSIAITAARTWNDVNGDMFPQDSELGPISNAAFGTSVPNTIYAPDVITKNRPYTWQSSVALEREVLPNVGVSVSYFRVQNYNWTVIQNTAVASSDYTSYCVTAPSNPGLPGGGNYPVCGLYDVNPAKFGKVSNLTTMASNFGSYTDTFNGMDIAIRSRFGKGGLLQGGVSMGKSDTNTCFANALPNVAAQPPAATGTPRSSTYCEVVAPWWAGNGQIKLSGNYPLPYGIQLAGVFQNLPGAQILASAVFTNAQIAPSLGRNLASCGAAATCNSTVTVQLIPQYTKFESRLNQFDLRAARAFSFRKLKMTPSFDVYNLFNNDTILARNNALGAAWGTPLRWLDGRLAKVGLQVTF